MNYMFWKASSFNQPLRVECVKRDKYKMKMELNTRTHMTYIYKILNPDLYNS